MGPTDSASDQPVSSSVASDASAASAGQQGRRETGVSELTQRVVFGVVAAPLVVLVVWFGGLPFALLLSVASGVAAWELFRMGRAAGATPLAGIGIGAAALVPLYVTIAEPRGVFEFPPVILAGLVLIVFAAAIWLRGADGRPMSAVSTTLFGIGYTGGLLSFAAGIRYHPYVASEAGGAALLLLPVLLTWANDIGAFFSGKLFGRKKLMPTISPGKTVAGAIGGLVACLILCWVYVQFVLRPFAQLSLSPRNLAVFAVVVSAAGQVGDLAESLLKREAGVKNSSGIFPGHGGVLDRVDSLLFALPVAWALFTVPGFLLPVP